MRRLVTLLASLLLLTVGAAAPVAAAPPDLDLKVHGVVLTTAEQIDMTTVRILTRADHPSTVTAMGRVTLDQTQSVAVTAVQPSGIPATGTITVLTGTLTSADGGSTLTYDSGPIPFEVDTSVSADGVSPIAFAGELVVTGGSGRFEGASGTLRSQGGYCFVRNAGFFLLDGTVTIPR